MMIKRIYRVLTGAKQGCKRQRRPKGKASEGRIYGAWLWFI